MTEWNDTPISDIKPDRDMQILCVSKPETGYNDEDCCYGHIFLNWNKQSRQWTDGSRRFFKSDDILMWKEIPPMSHEQLLDIQEKIASKLATKNFIMNKSRPLKDKVLEWLHREAGLSPAEKYYQEHACHNAIAQLDGRIKFGLNEQLYDPNNYDLSVTGENYFVVLMGCLQELYNNNQLNESDLDTLAMNLIETVRGDRPWKHGNAATIFTHSADKPNDEPSSNP